MTLHWPHFTGYPLPPPTQRELVLPAPSRLSHTCMGGLPIWGVQTTQ